MTPPAHRPTREKATDASYEEMRELIVDGRMAPGSRLIETDLVDRLKVSRTTIRSGLLKLNADGLVTRIDGGRVRWFVSPLTIKDIRELAEIMSALEGVAACSGAKLDTRERKRLASELREINDELRGLTGSEITNTVQAGERNAAFHHCLVRASGRPRLIAMCDSVRPQVERYVRTYVAHMAETRFAAADEHAAVVRAIETGNPEAAEIAIQSNWLQAAERYALVIDQVGERGTW